jgi:hypothetical protein
MLVWLARSLVWQRACAGGASSTAQHSTAQHSTAQHGTAQHGTAQHGTAQHGTAQHGTAQHGTGRHRQQSTAQHSTCAGGDRVVIVKEVWILAAVLRLEILAPHADLVAVDQR